MIKCGKVRMALSKRNFCLLHVLEFLQGVTEKVSKWDLFILLSWASRLSKNLSSHGIGINSFMRKLNWWKDKKKRTGINGQGFLKERYHQWSITGDLSRDALSSTFINYLKQKWMKDRKAHLLHWIINSSRKKASWEELQNRFIKLNGEVSLQKYRFRLDSKKSFLWWGWWSSGTNDLRGCGRISLEICQEKSDKYLPSSHDPSWGQSKWCIRTFH